MYRFRCSCSAFLLFGIDTCICHGVRCIGEERCGVEVVTQLKNDRDGSNSKTKKPWPTPLQDSSISQTFRRLDDATIGVCGTDVRRGERARHE